MNIQVTTRCNMRCIHCCFDCTAKGDDMPWDLFVNAVELAHRANDDICIGGGEPTLHPQNVRMVHEKELERLRKAFDEAFAGRFLRGLAFPTKGGKAFLRQGTIRVQLSTPPRDHG